MIPVNAIDGFRLYGHCMVEIANSHLAAWREIIKFSVPRNQWEAHFVARLCNSMHDVGASWKPVLYSIDPLLRINVSSVFTHQCPYVTWSGKTCELADLLVAFIDNRPIHSEPVGRAILIQAKQADGTSTKVTGKARKQFELLADRPKFDVIGSGSALAPSDVELDKLPSPGGLFYGLTPPASQPPLGFSHQWAGDSHWHTAWDLNAGQRNEVITDSCLAKTLVDLLAGKVGWDFRVRPGLTWSSFIGPPRHDWSLLINYLLQDTFARSLTGPSPVIRTGRRGLDYPIFFNQKYDSSIVTDYDRAWATESYFGKLLSASSGGQSPPHDAETRFDNFPNQGPLSVVLFELSSESQEPRFR